MFPELSLTPENLSTVLDSMDDGLWEWFSDYVNIPLSEWGRIRSQYSSDRECKQAAISSLISGHPAPSWRLVAHALYQMGTWPYRGGDVDSCHRALDRLQQLFPTGTCHSCLMCACTYTLYMCSCRFGVACKCVYMYTSVCTSDSYEVDICVCAVALDIPTLCIYMDYLTTELPWWLSG